MISTSTTGTECITLGHAVRDIVRIWKFVNEMNLNVAMIDSIVLRGNNEMCITLTWNVKSQHWIKYINIQYQYVWELVNKEELTIEVIRSFEILADGMTMTLTIETNRKHWALIEVNIN